MLTCACLAEPRELVDDSLNLRVPMTTAVAAGNGGGKARCLVRGEECAEWEGGGVIEVVELLGVETEWGG